MVKYPINLIDHMVFSQAKNSSPQFKAKKQKEVPPPSPQEFEASIKNDESEHEDEDQPICFTEDQIYDIQPEVKQDQIDNIIEKNKQLYKSLGIQEDTPKQGFKVPVVPEGRNWRIIKINKDNSSQFMHEI